MKFYLNPVWVFFMIQWESSTDKDISLGYRQNEIDIFFLLSDYFVRE